MKKALLASVVLVGASILANSAQAQSTVTATVTNNTPVSVDFSSPSGCQGTAGFTSIAAGSNQQRKITSPYSTSNGCSIRYTRSDNLRYCNWVLSRTRSSATGPWNYPTVNTTSSGTGVTCSNSITSVSATGDWSVNLTIAP